MSEERVTELYRTTDNDGMVLVILSDPDQFIVGEVQIVQSGKSKGEEIVTSKRYYPSLDQALTSAMHRIAKHEARDLKQYRDSIIKYVEEFRKTIGL